MTLDDGARGRLGREAIQEAGKRGLGALDLDEHALGVVDHPAVQAQLRGQPVDKWPEPDPLHRAVDLDTEAAELIRCGS